MKLEEVTVALRPRSPWEAVDLGCSMVRRDYGQVIALWAVTVLPLWAVIFGLMHQQALWFSTVIWWLKPLYDRVPLYYLSRAAFGERPGFLQTWREWPRLWSHDLLSALLWRRLSFIRSFAMPVIMLEGQKGAAMRKRVAALATDGGGSGASVTWVFLKLELAVFFGLLALTSDFVPESMSPNWEDLLTFQDAENFVIPPGCYWWMNACYLLTVTLVEPFYVGAGFGLYLNCRTKLEGWDVELAFRRLAGRLARLAAPAAVMLMFFTGAPAIAKTSPPPDAAKAKAEAVEKPAAPGSPNAIADEILARPDFKVHKKVIKQWQWDYMGPDLDGSFLAPLGYVLFWTLVAVLIGLLVLFLVRNQHLFTAPQLAAPQRAASSPRVVMGLQIGRDSLPDDILAAARELWRTRGAREALSLLYRGTLSRLMERHRLPIRDSDTEDDCLDHVRETGDRPIAGYFSQLTNAWMCEAYASLAPSEAEFERLCRDWPFQSGRAPAIARPAAALLLLLVPLLGGCSGHWEEEEKTLGYRGKARINPFLAAQTLLEELGCTAERELSPTKLPEAGDGVVFAASESGVSEGRARQLLSWAGRGGHLVYFIAGTMPYNDWSEGFALAVNFGTDDRPDPLLREFGVTLVDHRPKLDMSGLRKRASEEKEAEKKKRDDGQVKKAEASPAGNNDGKKSGEEKQGKETDEKSKAFFGDTTRIEKLKWGRAEFDIEVSDKLLLKLDRPLRHDEFAAGPLDDAAVLSFPHRNGRVTLINHARPLRNRFLGDRDHADWLMALVESSGNGSQDVRFIVGMTTSFWSLLWQRAWMPLAALLLVIAVWLWKNMKRFGPIMPLELSETKHFTDHVSALGQFFFRLHRGDVLLRSAAENVRSLFAKKFPQLAAGGDAAMMPRLAEKSGLPQDRVAAALAAHLPGHNHQLVRLLQDLQTLRQSL